MLRKSLISLLIAVALISLLAAAVGAQSATDEEAPEAPNIVPIGRGIVQAVPLTLTVNIPGPDGVQSYDVPVVLSLDIQIALGNVLTTSVIVTPELAITEGAVVTEVEVTEATPTPTPTAVPPTATPLPPTATPTQAAPTPQPVGQTPTAEPEEEPTALPEEEATPEAEEEATPGAEEEATPEPEPEAVIDPESCTDPRSVIFEPAAGEVISGTVEVFGTARHEIFNYYKLEYLQAGSETGQFAFIMDSSEPVTDGLLAELDTTELDNGEYVLRLTVVDNTGNFPPQCSVPVEIAN